jgi:hypothetical protein
MLDDQRQHPRQTGHAAHIWDFGVNFRDEDMRHDSTGTGFPDDAMNGCASVPHKGRLRKKTFI